MAGLKIQLSAIHKISDSSSEGLLIADYIKRIPWSISIQQITAKGKFPPQKQKIIEGELLLKSIPSGNFIIALDEIGSQFTSKEFVGRLNKIMQPISFIIGGAYGLSDEVRDKAHMLLSLSKMTMPHIMARVMLVEQLYRAYTINENHPYHK